MELLNGVVEQREGGVEYSKGLLCFRLGNVTACLSFDSSGPVEKGENCSCDRESP